MPPPLSQRRLNYTPVGPVTETGCAFTRALNSLHSSSSRCFATALPVFTALFQNPDKSERVCSPDFGAAKKTTPTPTAAPTISPPRKFPKLPISASILGRDLRDYTRKTFEPPRRCDRRNRQDAKNAKKDKKGNQHRAGVYENPETLPG